MTQTDIFALFKSMIDLDPGDAEPYACIWCRATIRYGGPVSIHEPDCQWIRAMDLLGLAHDGHDGHEAG